MDEIVAFAELERFIDLPVRTYSSGMYMRLGFSVAAHIEADVLLLDEVFAVGDEAFQRKCFGKIAEFKRRGGTIVFVSHDAQAVERLCDRAVLLKHGRRSRSTARRARRSRATGELLAAEREPRRARGRAARVGQRRGAGRLGPAARHRRRRARGSSPPASRSWSSCASRRSATSPAPQRLARAARRRRRRARRRHRRRPPTLGWEARAGRARAPLRGRPAAARRGPLPPPLRARSTATAARLLHSLGDAVQFFVLPTGTETGAVLLAGRWSMQEIGASEPIGFRLDR